MTESDKKKDMKDVKQKSLIYRIFIGFLIPYIIINGIIFFLIICKPHIDILSDTTSSKNQNVRFKISNLLPTTKISITKDNLAVQYVKDGNEYVIPINENGTIKIEVTSINQMTATTYIDISSLDDVSPTINIEDATFAVNTLTIGVTDNDSGINYDKIYGTIDGTVVQPIFIDKSTGTLKFKIESGTSITIHVEDNNGNISETIFEAG